MVCGLNVGKIHKQKNRKHFILKCLRFLFVRMKGLEPPRLSAPDPKSGAAANYATSALFSSLTIPPTFNQLVYAVTVLLQRKNATSALLYR